MRPNFMMTAAFALLLSVPAMAATPTAHGGVGTGSKLVKGETVEQRITNLHDELKITPAEEPKWADVATAMRQNAQNMQKMTADAQAADQKQAMTAKQDLETYQKFAQAHVDGLKNLRDAFDALYDSLPPDQQKLADQVFDKADRAAASSPAQH